MRVPIRKAGQYTHLSIDPHITVEKFDQLKAKLNKLKKLQRPQAEEVRRLAAMGDFSENAAYVMAKGRLRSLNQKILDLQDQIKKAKIIKPAKDVSKIQLGHKVTVMINGRQKTFIILGSSETNPATGIISHKSPLGAALLGRQVGDNVIYELMGGKKMDCQVISIT